MQKKTDADIRETARKAILRERVVLQRYEEKLNEIKFKVGQAQMSGLPEDHQKYQHECEKLQKKYEMQMDSLRVMMGVFKDIEARIKLKNQPGGIEN